jgi:hypothetical protein
MTDIVARLRSWVKNEVQEPDPASVILVAADEIERLRNGAVENRETVRDGVVPTVTWFDQKIAEECRIAQAEAARLRLTDAERQAIELFSTLEWTSMRWSKVEKNADTLRNLLERLK